MNILITGYPYVRENYLNTFNSYPEKDKVFFLLPEVWKVKKGKVVYHPPQRDNIFTTKAFFYHSNYPIIGGLLKGWMPAFPLKLYKLKKNHNIGLVYDSGEPTLLSSLYNALCANLFGLKYTFFSWENIPFQNKLHGPKGWIHGLILKLNLMLADGGVCGNQKCHAIFSKFTSKPLAVIPLSGLDEYFCKSSHDKSYLENYGVKDKVVFTFIGAIGYRKGIHLIIEAFKKVLDRVPASWLVIAGGGEYEENLKLKIENLKLEDKITRISWLSQHDVVKLLSASDVFVYPSISHGGWEEQFGYSIAEASLCELSIISTHSGSIEEVVEDGKTGILISENNVEELANAMIKLAQDDGLRKELGVRGRNFIKNKFSNEIIAQKFSNFFNSIISK